MLSVDSIIIIARENVCLEYPERRDAAPTTA
jgi:hypothetical protein